jgi:putative cardiolipin synthase
LRPRADHQPLSLRGSGQASLHTKAFTRDGETGFVGSLNFDPRSMSLNTEMGVLFSSPALVEMMDAVFCEETNSSMSFQLEMTRGNRIVWSCTEKGEPRRYSSEPNAPPARRLIAWVMGLLPLESQL